MKNNLSLFLKRYIIVIISAFVLILIMIFYLLQNRSEEIDSVPEIAAPNIKLAILNGCGVDGAATFVKNYFIDNNPGNIDVIAWRNVERNLFIYNKSIIVIKKIDEEKLDFLVDFTGIDRKIFALDANVIEDLQIILGDDYKEIFN